MALVFSLVWLMGKAAADLRDSAFVFSFGLREGIFVFSFFAAEGSRVLFQGGEEVSEAHELPSYTEE
jgi:hypothetical protein